MQEQKKEDNKKDLKLLKTKTRTPLERANERLRRSPTNEEQSAFPQEEQQPAPVPTIPTPAPQGQPEKIPESTPTPIPKPEPTPAPKPEPMPVPQVSKQEAKQELKKALEQEPSLKDVIPEPEKPKAEPEKPVPQPVYEKPEAPPVPKEEKLERLKREEVRTMQKDIKGRREFEIKRERQKIVGLQQEKEKARPMPEETKPGVSKPPTLEEPLIPKPPTPPSPLKKIFTRVGFFVILFLIIGFGYWFLSQREESTEETPEQEQEVVEEETEEEPEIAVSKSLISIKNTLTFNATSSESLNRIYTQIIAQSLTENEFVRIVIKNEDEKRLLTLDEIADAFGITIPSDVSQSLKTDSLNLLVYPQEHGKRAVIISEIESKQSLNTALLDWENEVIADGLNVLEQTIPTLSTSFRDYAFENVPFRFLTISMNDLGICYVVYNNYFALSSSFKSIEETIKAFEQQTVINELKDKAGQLFIVGFKGKTVDSSLEQFFKEYKPGGVLLLSENIENEEQLKTLTADLQTLSKKETGLPLFIAVDQEGDPISRIDFLTEKTKQSEITSENYAYAVGLKRGEELKNLGVNLNLSPVLDNAQNSDFVYERSFQKPVATIGSLAKSIITGQKNAGILTAIKHFPGYVNIDFNPEDKLATTDLPEISQFKTALESSPEMVMSSNVIYSDLDSNLPFSFSSIGIEFLKSELGPDILIISDDLSQNSLLNNFTLKEIITKPVLVGNDILIFSGWRSPVNQALDEFLKAVESQEISEDIINNAYLKISQLKANLE